MNKLLAIIGLMVGFCPGPRRRGYADGPDLPPGAFQVIGLARLPGYRATNAAGHSLAIGREPASNQPHPLGDGVSASLVSGARS